MFSVGTQCDAPPACEVRGLLPWDATGHRRSSDPNGSPAAPASQVP